MNRATRNKLLVATIIAGAWLLFTVLGWLNPVSIALLTAISVGFSVACLLSYVTYYDPTDPNGLYWARRRGGWRFYICILAAAVPCLYSSSTALMTTIGLFYVLPIFLIGRIRPVVPRRRSLDPDDHPHQSCVYDD